MPVIRLAHVSHTRQLSSDNRGLGRSIQTAVLNQYPPQPRTRRDRESDTQRPSIGPVGTGG
jgi:hypothetical protein